MPMNWAKDMAYAKGVAKDLMGKAARFKASKNMLIGAGVGLGLFAASRMSNNRYVRAAGDVAGLGALGVGAYAGAGYASRFGMGRMAASEAKASSAYWAKQGRGVFEAGTHPGGERGIGDTIIRGSYNAPKLLGYNQSSPRTMNKWRTGYL